MTRWMTVRSMLVCFAAISCATAIACDDDESSEANESGGSGGESSADVLQACNDIADALATAAMRCGHDYDMSRAEFLGTAAGGDCNNVASIRDRPALYDVCLPSLPNVSCEDLDASNLDPTCANQLVQADGLQCDIDSPVEQCHADNELAE